MAIRLVNIGFEPNDNTGDPLRVAFDKVNKNFQDLAAGTGSAWGTITGDLNNQVDLALRFDTKADVNHYHTTIPVEDRTGDYTLVLSDAGKLLSLGGSGDLLALTIPTHAEVEFPRGTRIEVYRNGDGGIVFIGDVDTPGVLITEGHAVLTKIDDNVWAVLGARLADSLNATFNVTSDIMLPLTGSVDVVINWGDGTIERHSGNKPTHTYDTPGVYQVSVYGTANKLGIIEDGMTPVPTGVEIYNLTDPLINGWSDTITGVESLGSIGITSLRGAFLGATNLEEFPGYDHPLNDVEFAFFNSGVKSVGKLDITAAPRTTGMFALCNNLETVSPMSSPAVVGADQMFYKSGLVDGVDIVFPNATTAVEMFFEAGAGTLTQLDLRSVTEARDIFADTGFNIVRNVNLDSLTDFTAMFAEQDIREVDGFSASTGTDFTDMFYSTPLEVITGLHTPSGQHFFGMFEGTNISTVDIDTTNAVDMSRMFAGCSRLVHAPVIRAETAEDVSGMFERCHNLVATPLMFGLDLVAAVEPFYECHSLEIGGRFLGISVDISYAGLPLLDRNSLVKTFMLLNDVNHIPGGRTIDVTYTLGAEELTEDDYDIALTKGWNVIPPLVSSG